MSAYSCPVQLWRLAAGAAGNNATSQRTRRCSSARDGKRCDGERAGGTGAVGLVANDALERLRRKCRVVVDARLRAHARADVAELPQHHDATRQSEARAPSMQHATCCIRCNVLQRAATYIRDHCEAAAAWLQLAPSAPPPSAAAATGSPCASSSSAPRRPRTLRRTPPRALQPAALRHARPRPVAGTWHASCRLHVV